MPKIFIAGFMFLLGVRILAHSRAITPASPAAGNPDPLVFVFLRVDREHDIAVLRPMIPPDIGVQLESGPRKLEPGAVLPCAASPREHDVIADTQIAKVTDLVLDCGDYKFVVKSLDFRPAR